MWHRGPARIEEAILRRSLKDTNRIALRITCTTQVWMTVSGKIERIASACPTITPGVSRTAKAQVTGSHRGFAEALGER